MRHFTIALLAGASALFAGSAIAAPITNISGVKTGSDIEHVRMVCDESGRCYRTRGARRVIVQDDSYAYAPQRRYRERGYYDEGPGVGVYAPGVGIGIGVGRDRW
ncbi:MAG TPA: hypothetical protein DEA80_07615 [Afipia sp.]|uniref:hypothetical protein n=1 Tax=unclassified Afipia TaxID=2642050 RepID=UPI000465E1E0|nr:MULTISPECIES: hypothetical protein [unclassified Afipia]MAH68038.1 hypothetical protein [Afipia sp.]OUX62880.1 MAG: hypothetical protein CBB64_02195 [Afipia sp. TMED4]HAO43867.1 hypothetical protein [Afipia sp.]HAP11458.1 hypothetical protein [Afipia sp.]HAP48297.1 hypothetical protein [Afipia sp.]|tara:strand:+ start:1226 stop:1540 length:315 start_codon:yes stop_codon:yes gene_type:complete